MAGEQEILKSIHYNNYIYLFNDPSDISICRKKQDFDAGEPGTTIGTVPTTMVQAYETLQRAGKNFYNNNNPLAVGGFLENILPTTTNSTTNLTPLAIEADSNPIIFSDKPLQGQFSVSGDFPSLFPGDTGQYFRGDTLPSKIRTESAANVSANPILGLYKFTNDIGFNPGNRHQFEISTQNGYSVSYSFESVKASVAASYEKLIQMAYVLIPEDLDDYAVTFGFPPESLASAIKANSFPTVAGSSNGAHGGVQIYNIEDSKGSLLGEFQYFLAQENLDISQPVNTGLRRTSNVSGEIIKFEYRQNFYFGAFMPGLEDVDIFEPIFNYYLSMITIPFGETSPNEPNDTQDNYDFPYNNDKKYVFNCSTKIGVPYDHKTLLKEQVNLKSYGVKDTAPTYQSEYNYYDPQYEPAATALINESVLNENVLPSIYDLLYAPLQKHLMDVMFSLSNDDFSIKNTSFNNLNAYLDNLSLLYGNYIAGSLAASENEDGFASTPVGSSAPMTERTLSDFEQISGQMYKAAESATPNTIFKTSKSVLITAIEMFGELGYYGTSDTSVSQLINSKVNFIPKWLEEIKSGIYFSEKTMPYFNQASDFKDRFPFVNTINIPQEKRGPIAKLFSKNDLLDAINTHAASLVVPNEGFTGKYSEGKFLNGVGPNTYAEFYGGMTNGYSIEKFNMYNGVKLKTFKMHFVSEAEKPQDAAADGYLGETGTDYSEADLFLDNFQSIGLETPKNVLVYSEGGSFSGAPGGILYILNAMKGQQLINELEEFLFDVGLRSPKQIQNGKFAHQETLMYEIAKYEVVGQGENYLQSIFLPIVNQESLSYIDSQVIPYKNYYYKIFAHKVIVGTKYRCRKMSAPISPNTIPNKLELPQNAVFNGVDLTGGFFPPGHLFLASQYEIEPYLQFVRVPYYNTPMVNVQTDAVNFTRIEDKPPMPPQVQVIPYRGVKDKVLFLLNNSAGEAKTTVIPILDSDLDSFDQCAISQGVQLPSADYLSEISFKNDDVPKSYTMFRMENKPLSYKDFFEDDTALFDDFFQGQTSLVDNIMPNKDYYYTFRTTDVHGKISNPTIVYQVRIVSELNSAPYLTVSTFDPREERQKMANEKLSNTKTFQKYLLFGLNNSENNITYPNLEVNDDDQALGDYLSQPVAVDSSVFGKKYKLRITSKQTGRKIDINVNFKNPKNTINNV